MNLYNELNNLGLYDEHTDALTDHKNDEDVFDMIEMLKNDQTLTKESRREIADLVIRLNRH